MICKALFLTIFTLFGALISSSDVVVLNADNFEDITKVSTGENGDWMIKFYAPWCGHCTKMAPTWEEFATETKGVVNVAKVDVTQNRELGSKFNIKGFPTLKYFHDGQVYDYSGPRTVSSFKEFSVDKGYTKVEGKRI